MADEIPLFQEDFPTLSTTQVESGAEGYEAFGKTLSALSSQGVETASNMADEKSKSMYVNSVANIEQVKTQAQEQMIKSPWAADKIQESTNNQLNSIEKNTQVNAADRNQLKMSVVDAQDEVGLKATETSYKQSQLGAAFTHYANFPDQLKAYQDALINDPDKAENLKNAMITTLKGLVMGGALTPNEAGNSIKSMQAIVDNTQRLHEGLVDPNFNAQQLHTLNGNIINPDKNDPNLPIDGSTQWLTDYYNGDKSLQGVLSDITTFRYPNPQAVMSLSANDYQHALGFMQGSQAAYGMINSGMPFPALEQKYKELSTQDKNLSYQDQGTKDSLKTYISDLKNGDYLSVIGRTPAGNRIMADYTNNISAIEGLGVSDDQKNAMLLQAKNKMVSDAVSYGAAHHIPDQYIQPIPNSEVATIKNAFSVGQDPTQVINILGQYNKQNQLYVAQAMKDPVQNMVIQGVAMAGGGIANQDKVDFIAANQKGRTYAIGDIKDDTHDAAMMARMASSLAPQLKILQSNYDRQTFGLMQNAMLSSTLKYAKYLAQQDLSITNTDSKGKVSQRDWNRYADQAVTIYKSAFASMTGTNWRVNSNVLPQPLTSAQLDKLAAYSINQGQNYLKGGVPDYEYERAYKRYPLTMTVSPTGNIQAVTADGQAAFNQPYTTKMMAAAEAYSAQLEKERQQMLPNYAKALYKNVKTKTLAQSMRGG